MAPGRLAEGLVIENRHWGTDLLCLRAHGSKELNSAGRRIGFARIKIAQAQEKVAAKHVPQPVKAAATEHIISYNTPL